MNLKFNKIFFIISLVLIILFIGCNNSQFQEVEFEEINMGCSQNVNQINSQSEFELNGCSRFEFVDSQIVNNFELINFSKYTLLSQETTGSGCETHFIKNLKKDDQNKKIIYTVTVEEIGSCEPLEFSKNWIITPKIPDNYIVEFYVK